MNCALPRSGTKVLVPARAGLFMGRHRRGVMEDGEAAGCTVLWEFFHTTKLRCCPTGCVYATNRKCQYVHVKCY